MILPYKDPEEARAKSREYGRRPEVKARRKTREKQYNKEYRERPEVKSRMKKYGKEYLQRPEVKSRRPYHTETWDGKKSQKCGQINKWECFTHAKRDCDGIQC